MSKAREKTIGVTAFKAKCLGLVEEVTSGKTSRVVLTTRGQLVAELSPVSRSTRAAHPSTFGALKHMMKIDPAVDLTAPTGIEFDAERGILLNE